MSANQAIASCSSSIAEDCPEFDLGKFLGNSSSMTRPQKMNLLKNCWTPPKSYDFNVDVDDSTDRVFIHDWLTTYEPWLYYSKKLKGALCLHCVLFPPTSVHGVLGAFSVTPFKKYRKIHEACRNHASSQWHKWSFGQAKAFMELTPINVTTISGHNQLIQRNRKIISSMISTIIFCGTNDLPLRGKDTDSGILF